MNNQNERERFSYTYSAKQQEEIKSIRRKYETKEQHEDDKMEQLRRLDAGVTKKGTVASLIVGIIGTLVMGTGMSCVMVWQGALFIPGIVIGCVGIALVGCAYPLYNHITKKERERITPEIIRLTNELMK